MTKCPDCPVATRCIAERTAHVAYCDWARAGGVRRDRVIDLSDAGEASGHDVNPPRPDTAEIMRLLKAARSCPYRSTDTACGCGGSRCALKQPGSRQIVSGQDCIECQRRYPDSRSNRADRNPPRKQEPRPGGFNSPGAGLASFTG